MTTDQSAADQQASTPDQEQNSDDQSAFEILRDGAVKDQPGPVWMFGREIKGVP